MRMKLFNDAYDYWMNIFIISLIFIIILVGVIFDNIEERN